MSCRCWFSIDRSLLLPWLGVYSWRDGGARFQSWDCHYVIITCSISTLLASSLLLMNLLGLWHQNGAKTKTRWDAVRFVWQLTLNWRIPRDPDYYNYSSVDPRYSLNLNAYFSPSNPEIYLSFPNSSKDWTTLTHVTNNQHTGLSASD